MTLTATRTLAASAARRDRIVIPVWVYALVASALSTAYSFQRLYPSTADREGFARGIQGNGSVVAVTGRLYDPLTIGNLVAWRMLSMGSAAVAVMSVLLVVRHTRADEEAQRLELLRSGVVGRLAPLAAALLIALQANLAIAVVSAFGLALLGLPVAGSVAFGLGWLAVGMTFAAVAGLTAQLAETARVANSLALLTVAVAFLVRAAGDAAGPDGAGWLSWLSPIGWAELLRPYAGTRWWVLALSAGLTVGVAGLAAALQGRRDLGAGVIAARPGPATGGPRLAGAYGLGWRLHRGAILGWTLGFAVFGVMSGAVAAGVTRAYQDSAQTRRLLAQLGGNGSLVDAFLATVMELVGLLAAAYAILAILRLRDEELSGRAELLLAGPLGRPRWTGSHLGYALAGSALIPVVTGLGVGIAHGMTSHDLAGQLPRLIAAGAVQIPAVWVVAGITLLVYAVFPRAAAAGWGVLGAFLLLGQLGPTLQLPRWAMDVSPFSHLPKLPGGAVTVLPLAVLVAVSAVLLGVGTLLLRRRDLR